MTPPLKLVAGPWEHDKIMRTRTLRYGTSRHESEAFKFSWQAHKWFLEQAMALV